MGSSARVITAAAIIMVTVFASFILTSDPIIKEFGVGLSIAILLDATIVRLVIVPVDHGAARRVELVAAALAAVAAAGRSAGRARRRAFGRRRAAPAAH